MKPNDRIRTVKQGPPTRQYIALNIIVFAKETTTEWMLACHSAYPSAISPCKLWNQIHHMLQTSSCHKNKSVIQTHTKYSRKIQQVHLLFWKEQHINRDYAHRVDCDAKDEAYRFLEPPTSFKQSGFPIDSSISTLKQQIENQIGLKNI